MAATVLIVDDETLLLRTLSNALRDDGYEVLSAGSAEGGEALLESRMGTVDLMVLDVKLPGRSGLDLLEGQRKRGYVGPAVVMTAFDSPDSEGRCRQLAVDRYLRKPFDLEAMLGLIQNLLSGRGIQTSSAANGTHGLTPEGG
ncbi:MAG: response regulator [Candidatus Eisenbacteria bacterium]|nr:response regulator [Candidatus Eisenbacteria bacterium]MCC7143862.1 response regulator [Candidatus Eisenbacteria bacterium]